MSLLQSPSVPSNPIRVGGLGGSFPVVIQPDDAGQLTPTITGCLLCLSNITPTTPNRNIAGRHNDVFQKLCCVFKVNLTPFSWDFMEEPFPFCPNCATTIFSLHEFFEKVMEIEKSIDRSISLIKSTIKSSENFRTSMPSDVRAVIFRGQILKDLETWTPQDLQTEPEVVDPSCESRQSKTKKKCASVQSTQGLVYNASKTPGPKSRTQPEAKKHQLASQTMPTLVAVSALEVNNGGTKSSEGGIQLLSSLVAESMNVVEGATRLEAEVEFRQLLGVVEEYPTNNANSPPKHVRRDVINESSYVAANETVSTLTKGDAAQSTEDKIICDVAPSQVDLNNDFEAYNDDVQGDSDYNASSGDEDENADEDKKAVAFLEHEVHDQNDSDYSPSKNRVKKRRSSTVTPTKNKVSFPTGQGLVKTEITDSDSGKARKRKKTNKSHREVRAKRPRSERKNYVCLIQTDSHGRMFYEGIPIKTSYTNPSAVFCGQCEKEFANHPILSGNKKSLILHIRSHHLDEWYDGDKLVKRTRAPPVSYVSMLETDDQGRTVFKGHQVIGAEGTVGFSCGTCGKSYTGRTAACENRSLVIRHIQAEHLNQKFACDQCDASYKSKGSLYDHKLKKHTYGELECDICGKMLFRKYLSYHRFTHMNEEEKNAAIAAGTAPAKALQRVVPYMCNVCGMILKGTEGLRRHEKTHITDTTECKFCGKQIKVGSLKDHFRSVHKKSGYRGQKCPHCNKFTKDLKRHITTHTPKTKRLFECSICGLRSATEESNRVHEMSKHKPGEARYIHSCDFCSKRFRSKKSRRDHHNRVHPAEHAASKQFVSAPTCSEVVQSIPSPAAAVDYSRMGRHLNMDISEGAVAKIERNDAGEMSFLTVKITKSSGGYECGMCGAVVRQKNIHDKTGFIKLHIRAYHLGEFQCDECGKFWGKLSLLTRHKKAAHLVVPCPVCQRPSGQKNLQLHLWTHKNQDEKQALIDAGDFYKIPAQVKQALGIPTLKFDVDCNVCGITFANKTLLEKHQRAEHPESRKLWNTNRRRSRKNINSRARIKARGKASDAFTDSDSDDEDDEFLSMTETEETENSEVDEVSYEETQPNVHNNRHTTSASRRCNPRKSVNKRYENVQSATCSNNRDQDPQILVSRLPDTVVNAKKLKVQLDGDLLCTLSDGEVKKISIVQKPFEITSSVRVKEEVISSDEVYSSGEDEDFALIPAYDLSASE